MLFRACIGQAASLADCPSPQGVGPSAPPRDLLAGPERGHRCSGYAMGQPICIVVEVDIENRRLNASGDATGLSDSAESLVTAVGEYVGLGIGLT